MADEPNQLQLDLGGVFAALQQPLSLVDNDERRAELQRFVEASRVFQERAIFDLLSQLTTGLNQSGLNGRLRLEYSGGSLLVVVEPRGEQEEEAAGLFRVDPDVERVTVRLPSRIKQLIDEEAGRRGISVNRWCVRTLARAVSHQTQDQSGETAEASRSPRMGRRSREAGVSTERPDWRGDAD